MSASIPEIFSTFQEYLDSEQDIREDIRASVKDIEQTAREILTVLQSIHQDGGIKEIPASCSRARKLFEVAGTQFAKLASIIPVDHYYKYHDHWRFVIQRLAFLAALTVYLESGQLASREDVAAMMCVKIRREDGFHLDLEDYLMGVLQLSSELSRFAVNSVTSGDYSRPLQISRFMAELSAGFRLLNLKNDNLRKRFDALKYDVKKVEEVVYDLTIRGLKPDTSPGMPAAAAGDSAAEEKA
ncbi:translin [Anabrus simplex]|uniref:translin n=1 Tax=Anabrus simplex TaxID=316456 RepID=UPI0034DD052E